jgi:hypothetical protein
MKRMEAYGTFQVSKRIFIRLYATEEKCAGLRLGDATKIALTQKYTKLEMTVSEHC